MAHSWGDRANLVDGFMGVGVFSLCLREFPQARLRVRTDILCDLSISEVVIWDFHIRLEFHRCNSTIQRFSGVPKCRTLRVENDLGVSDNGLVPLVDCHDDFVRRTLREFRCKQNVNNTNIVCKKKRATFITDYFFPCSIFRVDCKPKNPSYRMRVRIERA